MNPRFDPRRPTASPAFYKAHGLGNDYLVVEEGGGWRLDPEAVERVCHRTLGVGSDGIVVLLAPTGAGPFRLRMFNPDGSEFERSGNGLRVLASYLHRTGRVTAGRPFAVEVGGDRIGMTVHGAEGGHYDISVEMGRAGTGPDAVQADRGMLVPVRVGGEGAGAGPGDAPGTSDRPDGGARGAMYDGILEAPEGLRVPVLLVSVGNPHCVVFAGTFSRSALDSLGPALTAHPAFAAGANVQLARVVEGHGGGDGPDEDRGGGIVDALVWERGVGHTSASGTSACAVAVAAVRSGRLPPGRVEVRMEGGTLGVDVSEALDVVLRGPVQEVMTGELAAGFVGTLGSD